MRLHQHKRCDDVQPLSTFSELSESMSCMHPSEAALMHDRATVAKDAIFQVKLAMCTSLSEQQNVGNCKVGVWKNGLKSTCAPGGRRHKRCFSAQNGSLWNLFDRLTDGVGTGTAGKAGLTFCMETQNRTNTNKMTKDHSNRPVGHVQTHAHKGMMM